MIRHLLLSTAALAVTLLGAPVFRLAWGSSVYGALQRMLLGVAISWLVALVVTAGRQPAHSTAWVDSA